MQNNLANTYNALGQSEKGLRLKRDVYSARLRLNGQDHLYTITAANNCANALNHLRLFREAKDLLRKNIPVVRRVMGDNDALTLKMRWHYGKALYRDDGATLDDLREAVTALEDTERTARRVLGGAHPLTTELEDDLRRSRAALRARDTAPSGSA